MEIEGWRWGERERGKEDGDRGIGREQWGGGGGWR